MRKKDTIAAISTAIQPAGIAIVRLSGDKAIDITENIFKSKKPLSEASSHTVNYGHIVDNGEVVDEVLITLMKSPKTYTGEDIVEINCHGSIIIQKKILDIVIEKGARLADPGEFTMRAFLNGRIDLSQAEAVMDIISSENESALKGSISMLSGNFSAIIVNLREKILYEIAYIESALDDPEHISLDGYTDKLRNMLEECLCEIERLIENAALSDRIRSGIDCAIIGGVNVGKSSILNALSGEDRAIVTNIPGTTRDIVESKINMGDFTLNVIDTAGIRESDDEIEKIGILKSKEFLNSAGLILYVLDASREITESDIEGLKSLEDKEAIVLVNKNDLNVVLDLKKIEEISQKKVITVSAKELKGFTDLKEEIKNTFFNGNVKEESELVLTNKRHIGHLENAKKSLELVSQAIEDGMTEEIFAVDLTDAYESLGKILGKELGDDVIGEIFSKFCIGK